MNFIEEFYIPYQAEERIGRGKALIFAPHPDDEVFGCGGAIMRHVADGDDVRVIIVTDGAFGAGENARTVTVTRQAESRAAGQVLGYGEPVFWGFPDRGLIADENLQARISDEVSGYSPAWVYIPSWWEIHPDHTALSWAVTEAVRRGRSEVRLVQYEIGMTLHPNLLLDITGSLERKCVAMDCFGSQMERQSYDTHVLALNHYRTFTLPATVLAAEAYRVIDGMHLPEKLSLPLTTMIERHCRLDS